MRAIHCIVFVGGALTMTCAIAACVDDPVDAPVSTPPTADASVRDAVADARAVDASSIADASSVTEASAADATADASWPDVADAAAIDAGAPDADAAAVVWPDSGIAGCNSPTGPAGLSPATEGFPSAGLVLWLRGDRGVYTFAHDAGAAAPVCAWADQSGKGWLFTGSATTPPQWSSTGVSGRPAIAFPAAIPPLSVSGTLGIAATSPRTYVAVEVLVAGNGRFNPIMQGLGGSGGTYLSIDANTWQTAGNREGVYITNSSYDTATATVPGTTRVHVFTISSMTIGAAVPPNVDYRINGQTQTLSRRTGDNTIADFTGANFTWIGTAGSSSTGVTADGWVAEVLVYDRALTDTEKAAAETALKARYAIP